MIDQLTGSGLDVTYVCDPRRLEVLDDTGVLRILGAGSEIWTLSLGRLSDYNHVVVATERQSGRPVALVAALDGRTTHEGYLRVEGVLTRADLRGRLLMRRLLAALLLRIAGLGEVPTVVAAAASDPGWLAVVQDFGRRFRGAACFPAGPDAPIMLRSAALAQRVSRTLFPHRWLELTTGTVRAPSGSREANQSEAHHPGASCVERTPPCAAASEQSLVLIDLRTEGEADIIEEAVRIYRSR